MFGAYTLMKVALCFPPMGIRNVMILSEWQVGLSGRFRAMAFLIMKPTPDDLCSVAVLPDQ